ncbi:MAG: lysine--tRNA ligase [Bacilli bacterium]|nr:lysine--tRNA ligase [Bacilli bacterium]
MRQLSEQELVRRDKLKEINEYCNPYPEKFERTHTLREAKELADGTKSVSVCGRTTFLRKMGKLSFVKIRDIEDNFQLEFKIDLLGEEKYQFMKKLIDSGDFIGATGEIFTTQTGEKTLRVESFKFLGKALRPLPEKFHGLNDIETKYRERYVDLITNEESRKVFLGRSKYYLFLRNYLNDHGFLEVETPVIQTSVSGASAKPFFTHYNALDIDCNLRIAPECYLKECIAGGYDRVYEVARCFRNEGMDPQHNPEFTQVEWYAAYWNFEDNIKFFQDFLRASIKFLTGSEVIEYNGHTLDFSKDFERVNYVEKLTEILGFEFVNETDVNEYKQKVVEKGFYTLKDMEEYKSIAQLTDFLYKKLLRANIVGPVVMYNYPAVLKPLARRNDKNVNIADCFQVVVCGSEMCNAYSELVNPEMQRNAFEDQLKAKEAGDDETMDMDEDYLLAMEQGMPPISGLGIGIDRLIMIAYNQPSIKDVILFPTMKPEGRD